MAFNGTRKPGDYGRAVRLGCHIRWGVLLQLALPEAKRTHAQEGQSADRRRIVERSKMQTGTNPKPLAHRDNLSFLTLSSLTRSCFACSLLFAVLLLAPSSLPPASADTSTTAPTGRPE